jgi:hypothetical protein
MATKKAPRRWSRRVMETSDAMDLETGVFKKKSPRAIARSVARSAERSKRRKAPPFRSAMSMLTFYVNRGGKNLSAAAKQRLMRAKDELRKLYGKPTARGKARPTGTGSGSGPLTGGRVTGGGRGTASPPARWRGRRSGRRGPGAPGR